MREFAAAMRIAPVTVIIGGILRGERKGYAFECGVIFTQKKEVGKRNAKTNHPKLSQPCLNHV